jgi:hypothetical protein
MHLLPLVALAVLPLSRVPDAASDGR